MGQYTEVNVQEIELRNSFLKNGKQYRESFCVLSRNYYLHLEEIKKIQNEKKWPENLLAYYDSCSEISKHVLACNETKGKLHLIKFLHWVFDESGCLINRPVYASREELEVKEIISSSTQNAYMKNWVKQGWVYKHYRQRSLTSFKIQWECGERYVSIPTAFWLGERFNFLRNQYCSFLGTN